MHSYVHHSLCVSMEVSTAHNARNGEVPGLNPDW